MTQDTTNAVDELDPWSDRRLFIRAERRAGYIGLVIITGWIISGVIGIGIVLATAYLAIYSDAEVPEVLINWGGVIIGFYFGQFFSLIKDYMNLQFQLQRPRNGAAGQ